ncbi:sporulation protein YjcZ [Bacillus mojavensis]|nr:sporulation protein YjcZ [Bacillus mojavensis]
MYSGYLYTYPFGGWPYGASRAYAFIVVLIVVLLIVGGVYWFT